MHFLFFVARAMACRAPGSVPPGTRVPGPRSASRGAKRPAYTLLGGTSEGHRAAIVTYRWELDRARHRSFLAVKQRMCLWAFGNFAGLVRARFFVVRVIANARRRPMPAVTVVTVHATSASTRGVLPVAYGHR